MRKPKGSLKMDSPAQNADPKGGIVSNPKTKTLSGKGSGKGTKSHLAMEGPDLAGGGWVTGKK
jgi:hypothetical protein